MSCAFSGQVAHQLFYINFDSLYLLKLGILDIYPFSLRIMSKYPLKADAKSKP
jgi:hypothetical protein